MNAKNVKGFLIGVFTVASTLSVLAAVNIPHVFKSGDLITASDFNENFSSLKAGIDAVETSASAKQTRVSGVCAAGSSIREVKADGTVTCQTDNVGTGGGASYTAGAGLTLAANQFRVDATKTQSRVSGICAAGSAIKEVKPDGQVICEAVGSTGGGVAGVSSVNGKTGGVTLEAGTGLVLDNSQTGKVILSSSLSAGLSAVQTDATLTGDGTGAAKLGLKLPLLLSGSNTGSSSLLEVSSSSDGAAMVGRSQSGAAVVGVSQSGSGLVGVSVDGAGLKVQSYNGFAIEAKGNLKQDLGYYGLPKAMVFVRINPTSGSYEIVRCFNSQQTGILVYANGCGMTLKIRTFEVDVDFGFSVVDRFVSITSVQNFAMSAITGDTFATSTIVTAGYIGDRLQGLAPKLGFQLLVY